MKRDETAHTRASKLTSCELSRCKQCTTVFAVSQRCHREVGRWAVRAVIGAAPASPVAGWGAWQQAGDAWNSWRVLLTGSGSPQKQSARHSRAHPCTTHKQTACSAACTTGMQNELTVCAAVATDNRQQGGGMAATEVGHSAHCHTSSQCIQHLHNTAPIHPCTQIQSNAGGCV